ncbi:hypothetical protein [Alteromonas oceanisediminis]|uniref:hypothetical protein n=1 Tax=Alteromonas oceanisediminis TaxID=2836180 RepID=UPI001BDA26F9|nr:hypothetical protein [Alteromonas oceanisediminis]MBT0585115.1 hypothetical protein [Alteromonas oceanisediminis]
MPKHNKSKGHFAGIPSTVMKHPDYFNLSFSAKALLFEFAFQYKSYNNGKLCAVFAQLKDRGWKSETTLRKAIQELIRANMIICTKQGMYGSGKRLPNYYAVTWQPIDEIHNFKMDVDATVVPIRKFSIELRGVRQPNAA